MLAELSEIENLSDLRQFVHSTICHQNQLEFGAFRMTERIMTRRGKPCGFFFCVHGPRSVKLTAIWETESNSILFYGSAGERLHKAQLVSAPGLVPVAA